MRESCAQCACAVLIHVDVPMIDWLVSLHASPDNGPPPPPAAGGLGAQTGLIGVASSELHAVLFAQPWTVSRASGLLVYDADDVTA